MVAVGWPFTRNRGKARGVVSVVCQRGNLASDQRPAHGEKDNGQRSAEGKMEADGGRRKATLGQTDDDELAQIDCDREKLSGTIQEKYGIAKKEAERQIDAWTAKS